MPTTPENHLYEYAVIRYLPQVEREEFINVGLIMMCKRRRWLRVDFCIDRQRIESFSPRADIETLRRQLDSFRQIADATATATVATLEPHERFRWLTAVRSACIATSPPHPGLTTDLDATFTRLFAEHVATPPSPSDPSDSSASSNPLIS